MTAMPGVDVGGQVGTVLGRWDGADMDTGELLERAAVLLFGPPSGRYAVRTPEVRVVTIDPAALTPPRPRHMEARWLCGWLGSCKRTVDPKQTEMVRVLVSLMGGAG